MRHVTKSSMERMCRNAGMEPVSRGNIAGHEIFIADGYSMVPGVKFAKFGAEPGDPPAHVALWFATKGEDLLEIGRALFFKGNDSKQSRIKAAMKDARDSIAALELARRDLAGKVRLH